MEERGNSWLIVVLVFVVIALAGYIVYDKMMKDDTTTIEKESVNNSIKEENSGQQKNLSVDSFLVQNLYRKVTTNKGEEETSGYQLDDMMKLYLAYRQVPRSNFFQTNCDGYQGTKAYACNPQMGIPYGVNASSIQEQVKELFGENVVIPNQSITRSTFNVLGVYVEYIPSRDIYLIGSNVGGGTDDVSLTKTLTSAYIKDAILYLEEDVNYTQSTISSEASNYYTKYNGKYRYQFKMEDGRYIYINKEKIN